MSVAVPAEARDPQGWELHGEGNQTYDLWKSSQHSDSSSVVTLPSPKPGPLSGSHMFINIADPFVIFLC